MATKKRRASLPRVTVMAYRRQDLVAFVQAVETLRLLVDDLRILLAERRPRRPAKTRGEQHGATAPAELCRYCKGSGHLPAAGDTAVGGAMRIHTCPQCLGTGRSLTDPSRASSTGGES